MRYPMSSRTDPVAVRPVDVRVTVEFTAWVESLPYAVWVVVMAGVEHLAAYGRRLDGAEVGEIHTTGWGNLRSYTPWPWTTEILMLFAYTDKDDEAILLGGGFRRNERKLVRSAARRCRTPRRWRRLIQSDLPSFRVLTAGAGEAARADIATIRADSAYQSIRSHHTTAAIARRRMEIDLDYLAHQSPDDVLREDPQDRVLLVDPGPVRAVLDGGEASIERIAAEVGVPLVHVQGTPWSLAAETDADCPNCFRQRNLHSRTELAGCRADL